MSTIPAASTAIVCGLEKTPILNNRLAIVLRQSVDDPSRYVVYVLPVDQQPSCVVRIKHQNLCLQTSTTLPALYSVPKNPSPLKKNVLFPIRAPIFETMSDTSYPPFFYAYGNTSPVYVLPGVEFNEEDPARVLLLSAGDLRSALYSLARDRSTLCETHLAKSKSKPGSTKQLLLFTFNDMSVDVIARNIVILWLLHQSSVSVKSILDIWFCLRFGSAALTALLDAVITLTGPNITAILEEIGVRISHGTDIRLIQAIIARWLTWVGIQQWSEVLQARHDCLQNHMKGSMDSIVQGFSSMIRPKYSSVNDNGFPFESAEKEMIMLVREGRFHYSLNSRESDPSEDSLFVNPTLFLNPHKYHLHYGSIPHEAFPSFADSYHAHHPLLTLALTSIADWRNGIITAKGLVEWEFDVGDCINFLSSFPVTPTRTSTELKFNVVATSNVADHLGLLPLLLASRYVVKDNGILLTQSLRYSSYSSNQDEYLQKNLIISPDRYASILGWHCCGYEGSGLEALPGGVITHLPSFFEISTSALRKKFENVDARVELNLVWKPVFSCFGSKYGNFLEQGAMNSKSTTVNTFLSLEHDNQVQELAELLKPEFLEHPLSEHAHRVGFYVMNPEKQSQCNGSHLMTLLPIFLKCKSAEEVERLLKVPSDVEMDPFGEIRDIASAILRGRAKEELEVASVKVPFRFIKDRFELVKRKFESMMLTVLVKTKYGKIPFSGIQVEILEDGQMFYKLSWVWKKNFVTDGCQGRNPIVLLGSVFHLAHFSLDDLEIVSLDQICSSCDNETNLCLPSWIQSFIDNRISSGKTSSPIVHNLEAQLRDDGLEWNVNILLNDTHRSNCSIHMEMIDVRIRRFQTRNPRMSQWEIYSSKDQQSKSELSPCVLTFPGPVKSCKITIDKEHKLLRVCGIKDCYDLRFSMGISRFSSQDSVAFPKMPVTPSGFLVTMCGCQFSPEERFQARTRGVIRRPPVPNLKDSLISLLLLSDQEFVVFGLQGDNNKFDIRIVGINHGVLRNHCNGTPLLDISLCVLDYSFADELFAWYGQKSNGMEINPITMNLDELDLFKQLLNEVWSEQCKLGRSNITDLVRTQYGAPACVSKHFKRVLIEPLISPATFEIIFDSMMGKGNSIDEEKPLTERIRNKNSLGKKYILEHKWSEAIREYSLALSAVYENLPGWNVASEYGESVTRLAVECWLNMAHCHLNHTDISATSRNKWALDSMKEVCVCCDSALELLNNQLGFFDGMDSLKKKAKFRKALAMTRKGSTPEARTLLQQALQL